MATRARRGAFTIIELVIVVMILGVLAGVAVPRLFDMQMQAASQATVTQVLEIFDAAEIYHAQHGKWPDNADVGFMPPEFKGILPERLFTEPSPIGRSYDWNGPGTGMPTYGVSIPSGFSSRTLQLIDDRYDDGDLTSGWITRWKSGAINFELAPK